MSEWFSESSRCHRGPHEQREPRSGPRLSWGWSVGPLRFRRSCRVGLVQAAHRRVEFTGVLLTRRPTVSFARTGTCRLVRKWQDELVKRRVNRRIGRSSIRGKRLAGCFGRSPCVTACIRLSGDYVSRRIAKAVATRSSARRACAEERQKECRDRADTLQSWRQIWTHGGECSAGFVNAARTPTSTTRRRGSQRLPARPQGAGDSLGGRMPFSRAAAS